MDEWHTDVIERVTEGDSLSEARTQAHTRARARTPRAHATRARTGAHLRACQRATPADRRVRRRLPARRGRIQDRAAKLRGRTAAHAHAHVCVSRTHTRARAAGRAQIYLPLLWRAAECCAWPLALSFHHGHFCALALLHRQSKLDGARNSVCSSHARQACARACARGMATPSWVLPYST
jgi:hypothetical protein